MYYFAKDIRDDQEFDVDSFSSAKKSFSHTLNDCIHSYCVYILLFNTVIYHAMIQKYNYLYLYFSVHLFPIRNVYTCLITMHAAFMLYCW